MRHWGPPSRAPVVEDMLPAPYSWWYLWSQSFHGPGTFWFCQEREKAIYWDRFTSHQLIHYVWGDSVIKWVLSFYWEIMTCWHFQIINYLYRFCMYKSFRKQVWLHFLFPTKWKAYILQMPPNTLIYLVYIDIKRRFSTKTTWLNIIHIKTV